MHLAFEQTYCKIVNSVTSTPLRILRNGVDEFSMFFLFHSHMEVNIIQFQSVYLSMLGMRKLYHNIIQILCTCVA